MLELMEINKSSSNEWLQSTFFLNMFLQYTPTRSFYAALGKLEEKNMDVFTAKMKEQFQWNFNHIYFRNCKSK